MQLLTPDPTFYPSPAMATQAPPETLGYVALVNSREGGTDAIGVVDLDPASKSYGRLIGQTGMPHAGDELHHFGWNACSSCLCPYAPHPHMERRYLVVPGIHSSRIHILDTKPDPRQPQIVKVIEPETIARRTGYAAPHTVHCGPEGILVSALGAPDGNGPGGTFLLDPETFEVRGRWELDRGPQELAYDVWWHLGLDTMISSTWGTPQHGEARNQPRAAARRQVRKQAARVGYAPATSSAGARSRRRAANGARAATRSRSDARLRICRRGRVAEGSVLVGLVWYRDTTKKPGQWAVKKVIEIPAEPADPEKLPPLLQGFKAVAPLVTDIELSVDDRYLYVSCWGLGEFIQYDVTDPFNPKKVSSLKLGGMVNRTAHSSNPGKPVNGGPQMVEVSRDGRRIYFTNSLYTPWDRQIYPDGIQGWIAKADIPANGPMKLDTNFFIETGGLRPHQIRLEGGDASSDSYCYA
jgi:selenium-binding protein 1